ncbi:MAG: hypothetical protein ACOVSW_18530 [Candidatus Kapaibacteriota bacterium]|jgi:hypothetical protein
MAYDDDSKDPRIRATQSVWGIACGMMGISIPLIAITGGAGGMSYLPLMVIAGAAASSLAIWFAPQREKTYIESAPMHELEDIKRGILDLRDYIGSLEQKIEDQELQLRITQAGTGNQETKNPPSSPT